MPSSLKPLRRGSAVRASPDLCLERVRLETGRMAELAAIFKGIILPIFILVGAGAALEKRFKLDIATISKLNFFVFVPALLFRALLESKLEFEKLAVVAAFQVALILVMLAASIALSRGLKLEASLSSAFILAVVFCNSANYGIPLVQLAFATPEDPLAAEAVSFQAITIMVQNISTFTLGLLIIGHGKASAMDSLRHTLRLPFVYVVAAALILKAYGVPVTKWTWFWSPVSYMANGLVAVALLTLGVQIAKTPSVRRVRTLAAAGFARLALAPVAAFLLVRLFALFGLIDPASLLARVVVIAAAGPSAVNTVLLALEFRNEPDFAASSVFYSTLFSGLTVAVAIFLVRGFM